MIASTSAHRHTRQAGWTRFIASLQISRDGDDKFAFEFGLLAYPCEKVANGSAFDVFEQLCQVVAERGLSIAQDGQRVLKEGFQAVGAFVEDERVGRLFIDFEEAAARPGLAGRETAKGEGMDGQAG